MHTVYSQRQKYVHTKSSTKPYAHSTHGLIIIELGACEQSRFPLQQQGINGCRHNFSQHLPSA